MFHLDLSQKYIQMKNTLLITAGIVLSLTACKKEEEKDTTKPEIKVTSPIMEQEYKLGDTIRFKGSITDNENLASFKTDIHLGEGHKHKSISGNRSGDWEYKKTTPISGTSYTINEEIIIPASADTGEYHFIVNALDEAGNAANFVEVDIDVKL